MTALLSFNAADIRLEGVAVDAALPTDWLAGKLADTEVEADGDGRIRGRLSRSGVSDIVVRTRVSARLSVACVRCLEPAAVHVDADLSLLLVPATRADARRGAGKPSGRNEVEHEFSAEEAHEDVYDGENVVLDDFVRELLLLEVPSFPLCRNDCPGIAVRAVELPPAADPRLAPLSAFRDESQPKGEGGPITVDDLVAAAQARSSQLRGIGKRAVLRSSHAAGRGKRKK